VLSISLLELLSLLQTRTDKRPDRVEVSVEQLAAASSVAEEMSLRLGRQLQVVGWVHTHPHISCLPSHVDVRTQQQYQLMDSRFVGLIFAVFQQDAAKIGKIEVSAFQATSAREDPNAQMSSHAHDSSLISSSSSSSGCTEWLGKNVALSIRPPNGGSTVPLADALSTLTGLQATLFAEEQAAYSAALQQHTTSSSSTNSSSSSSSTTDAAALMEAVYCSSVFSKSIACLMGESTLPLLQTVESHLCSVQAKKAVLAAETAALRAQLSPQQAADVADLVAQRQQPVRSATGCM
jgi:BRCC36 C-terminal helical domain/JAB1/Mov34/MPN/PAD-1 ubiquitin protease